MAASGGDAILTRHNVLVKGKLNAAAITVSLENNDTGVVAASYTLVGAGALTNPALTMMDDGRIILFYIDTGQMDHKWRSNNALPTDATQWTQIY